MPLRRARTGRRSPTVGLRFTKNQKNPQRGVSPDGRALASRDGTYTVRRWDTKTGIPQHTRRWRSGAVAASVLTILRMVTMTATRHNPAIRTFCTRPCRRGQPGKAALVTARRKFLLVLNAVIRDKTLGRKTLLQQPSRLDCPHSCPTVAVRTGLERNSERSGRGLNGPSA